MHNVPVENNSASQNQSIFAGVTFYHWLVVIIASCGWLFDCMDQRLFTIARESALTDLLSGQTDKLQNVKQYIGWATAAMMIGWATGGIIFGILSDKWGRVKTMMATLLVYSGFTGLCGLAHGWVDFMIYRFLVGLGVGGMFAAATTLVAESVPARFRTFALGSLQALSATGNIIGSLLSLGIQPGTENLVGSLAGWRVLFFVGIVPAILAVPIMLFLKEPEPWKNAKAAAASGEAGKQVGAMADLFRHPRWRRNTLVGICLGLAGMAGLWGIGFFSPELITTALKSRPLKVEEIIKPAEICQTLKSPNNDAVIFIREQLSETTRQKLDKWQNGAEIPAELLSGLVADLNAQFLSGNVFKPEVFQKLSLNKATTNLLAQITKKIDSGKALPKEDIAFANRMLLEQTFPGGIAGLQKAVDKVRSRGMALQDVGSLLGMFAFTWMASVFNRRKAFLTSFILCFGITAFVFYSLKTEAHAYIMLPMMGFAQLALFAGYSIYFPEIYPTRLRGTGVGFCYNTVRYLAAPFPALLGWMSTQMPFRTAAIIMSSIYIIGMIALIWAPETKGKPLPED